MQPVTRSFANMVHLLIHSVVCFPEAPARIKVTTKRVVGICLAHCTEGISILIKRLLHVMTIDSGASESTISSIAASTECREFVDRFKQVIHGVQGTKQNVMDTETFALISRPILVTACDTDSVSF
jgi:hypothetical protein